MTGRPTLYTPDLADVICDRLINGESLRKVCADEAMPDRSTVLRWIGADEAFATKYARARTMQADLMDDMILDTAAACTSETAAADRVKIGAYQWRASKLAPKKYGDKVALVGGGEGDAPIRTVRRIERVIVDPSAPDT
jgi:hypothetical protein